MTADKVRGLVARRAENARRAFVWREERRRSQTVARGEGEEPSHAPPPAARSTGDPAPPHAAHPGLSAPRCGPGRARHGPPRAHERFTNLRGGDLCVGLRVRASSSRPPPSVFGRPCQPPPLAGLRHGPWQPASRLPRAAASASARGGVCHGSPASARRLRASASGATLSPTPRPQTSEFHEGARSGPRRARPYGPHGALHHHPRSHAAVPDPEQGRLGAAGGGA